MEYLLLISGIIIAYLIGSIPSSVWVSKWFYGIDIRTEGSGNAGATNTFRVLGTKAAIPVMIFDVFKGWFAVYIAHYFIPEWFTHYQIINYEISLAAAAVLGHVFPVFAGFRGGKGIATLLGVGIALFPLEVLITAGIFIVVLLFFRYVSLASIIASVCFPFIVIFLFNNQSVSQILLSIFVGIFVPLTHRRNIKRLLKKTESKISFKKKS